MSSGRYRHGERESDGKFKVRALSVWVSERQTAVKPEERARCDTGQWLAMGNKVCVCIREFAVDSNSNSSSSSNSRVRWASGCAHLLAPDAKGRGKAGGSWQNAAGAVAKLAGAPTFQQDSGAFSVNAFANCFWFCVCCRFCCLCSSVCRPPYNASSAGRSVVADSASV